MTHEKWLNGAIIAKELCITLPEVCDFGVSTVSVKSIVFWPQ
jgi:hypothetical protein